MFLFVFFNANMEDTDREVEVQQFAKTVHHYSSQYGSETSISYTVHNLAGMCTKFPHYGDFTQACVFRTYGPWWQKAPSAIDKPFGRVPESFNSVDYVELYFSECVLPRAIEIFETYNPGSVVRVLAYVHTKNPAMCATGCYEAQWMTLWASRPERAPPQSRIFSPPLKELPYPTNLVRLELNPVMCHYYTELDGVRLTGIATHYRLPDIQTDNMLLGPCPDYETALREYGTPVDPFPLPVTSESGGSAEKPATDLRRHPATTQLGPHGTMSTDSLSCSESLVEDLSRLHVTDGLSAALDPSDNGYFDRLPGEVVQSILSHLDTVSLCHLAQTCRLLRVHSYDPLQFTDLSLQPYWSRVSDDTLDSLHTRCRYIQRLSLSWCGGCTCITPSGLSRFLDVCGRHLTTLHLACCRFLNDSSMAALALLLAKNCPNIEDIDLQSNKTIFTGISFQDLRKLKRLRRLNLYRTFIDTVSVTGIIRGCLDLEFLNLGACSSINEFDVVATELSVNCKGLKHLDVWRGRSLSVAGVRALVANCPDLEELDLGWVTDLRSGSGIFVELAKSCRKLRKLFLTANRTICDVDIDAFAQYNQQLEQLDILGTREVSPKVIRKLLENCGKLRLLDVSFCSGITVEVVEAWEQLYPLVDIKRSFQT